MSDTMRTAAGLVAATGLPLLAAACGSGSPAVQVTGSSQVHAALVFAQCMRSHGVANFPDPDPEGNFPPFSTVSKQKSTVANDACKHLLSSRHGGTLTRGDQQKLALALRAAQCMRRHGYPTYPDPANASASSQGSGTRFSGTGIDTKAPRFQATETACEQQTRKALGLQ